MEPLQAGQAVIVFAPHSLQNAELNSGWLPAQELISWPFTQICAVSYRVGSS
jgi:hypothetical protein